jgi:hypothetical protein
MMKIAVLGIDLGKNVCSVVGLDPSGAVVYCSPVLRHPAGLIQAANFRSAIAF